MKRNVACSWAQAAATDTFYALTPPQDQEPARRNENGPRFQSHPAGFDGLSVTKDSHILPGPRQLQRLFDIFFARHHGAELCSFFHKPSLDIPTVHNRSPLLVTSVISLAALYIPTDEVEADFGFQTPSALSDHYGCLAKSYAFGLCDEPSSKLHLFCSSSCCANAS